jgi:hypothetical protein
MAERVVISRTGRGERLDSRHFGFTRQLSPVLAGTQKRPALSEIIVNTPGRHLRVSRFPRPTMNPGGARTFEAYPLLSSDCPKSWTSRLCGSPRRLKSC